MKSITSLGQLFRTRIGIAAICLMMTTGLSLLQDASGQEIAESTSNEPQELAPDNTDPAPEGNLAADPYVVFVAGPEVHARCGPSDEFYRTDSLRTGQELEVYVETADGWLGIRPPAESFCWIPASAVKLSGDSDQATVVEDRTVAWIGTHLGRARRYRWQVQLALGEPVTILGKSERDGPDGPQLWFRIVPPSGEFRWVHRDDVVESSEELVARVQPQLQADSEPSLQPAPRPNLDSALVSSQSSSESFAAGAPRRRPIAESTADPEKTIASVGRRSEPIGSQMIDGFDVSDGTGYSRSARRPDRSFQPSGTFGDANDDRVAETSRAPENAGFRQPRFDEPVGSGLRDQAQTSLPSNAEMYAARDNDRGTASNGMTLTLPTPAPELAKESNWDATEVASDKTVGTATDRSGAALPRESKLAIVGSPRIASIGRGYESMTPAATDTATDANWVGGVSSRPSVQVAQASYASSGSTSPSIAQVSGTLNGTTNRQPTRFISAELIAQIDAETRGASAEKLQLLLSRIMAAGGSAQEADAIAKAAERLASNPTDELESRRAASIVERARLYQRIAQRRDGESVIRSGAAPSIPATVAAAQYESPLGARPAAIDTLPTPAIPSLGDGVAASDIANESGFLVQVYSARPNSPPFALTDHGGRTIAYVTPVPGVNIRMHLNNHIRVVGRRGFVSGLDTPHILAETALRVAE